MISSTLYKVTFLAALIGVRAGLDLSRAQNVAVYWGQNSNMANGGQQPLSYYCKDSDEVDVYMLAFVTMFNGLGGYPETNFANAGNNCTTFSHTNLLDCPQIAQDIITCQGLGKTILLSIGGGTYTEGGFSSEDEAVEMANLMWEAFGPESQNSSVLRPFGAAVVDGFDFDFEGLKMSNMDAYANQMRKLYDTDTSKTYYMTAAPQCVYPDEADGPMLNGSVSFDAIWIQFYNNACGLTSFIDGNTTQKNFNFDVWDSWAKKVSVNPNVRVFLGVPGGTTAASGYESPSVVGGIINYVTQYSSFGGVMIWDASQAWANTGFISSVYAYLPTGISTSKSNGTPAITTSSTTAASISPTSTPTLTSSTCPVAGALCPTSGLYACTGSNYGICSNGVWVVEPCPSGDVCFQIGEGVYCGASGSSEPVCS